MVRASGQLTHWLQLRLGGAQSKLLIEMLKKSVPQSCQNTPTVPMYLRCLSHVNYVTIHMGSQSPLFTPRPLSRLFACSEKG